LRLEPKHDAGRINMRESNAASSVSTRSPALEGVMAREVRRHRFGLVATSELL
jgi:hypothetical protein